MIMHLQKSLTRLQVDGEEALFALLQFFPDNLNTIIELHVRKFGLERAFNLSPSTGNKYFQ